jgi:hypothetical protein
VRTVSDHPPVSDLVCLIEPAVQSEETLTVDPAAGLAFDQAVLLAGRDCRDALKRVCGWHKDRGAPIETCEAGRL